MKIHIDGVNFLSNSGPNSFGQRFARKLIETGHDVNVESGSDSDVSLVFIEPSGRPLAEKIVQRLDGIWFRPNEFETKNVNIKDLYDHADAIVWQSDFDRCMTYRWWGDRKGRIIHNGIDTQPVKISNGDLLSLRSKYETIFVCSSNWHPQKRLRTNIELFFHLMQNGYPNSCLIVMGANPDCQVANPHVFYTGSLPHDLCLEVYRVADWMIHLAWLDHCPNVVVEALSQETPVICTDSGGTQEIVHQFGVVLSEQETYEYDLVDYDKPPTLNFSGLKLPDRKSLGRHFDISMDRVVRSYLELFEEII